ncbi:MAG: MgtC/SapB family protein [Planctomycetes bacterium]|nr:MgtC/SapB family protein [Planctomycetota bacterium]
MFDTPQAVFFFRAGVALVLGLSVGLEREKSAHDDKRPSFAGIRTFPICSLTGFLCAVVEGNILLFGGFLGVAAIATVAYWRSTKEGFYGITTEAAYLLTFLLGAACGRGMILEAASICLVMTTLLAGKDQLRLFAQTLPERDLAAALKFGVISVIILPLIPDRPFGQDWYGVNFYKTWLMVVLISGIGFAGYILTRIVGPRTGTGLAGLVGGMVSSTAVTLSFSKRSRESPSLSTACALAIVAACAVLWVRVWVEAVVVNRSFAFALAQPVGILLVFSIGAAAILYRRSASTASAGETGVVTYKNPVELMPAIKFALVFLIIGMVFKIAQKLGPAGSFVAAFLSGLSDMDAVTLSMANMTKDGKMTFHDGAVSILLAGISNTLVKLGIVIVLSSPSTRRAVAIALGATCLVALGVLVWVHRTM